MKLFRRSETRPIRRRNKEEPSIARHVFYGALVLVLVVLLGVLVSYVTRREAVSIDTIDVRGGETISYDEVRSRVEQELSGTYFRLIPHRFSYLYPHDAIVKVLEEIPRIYDVTVVRSSRHTLVVRFDEYVPYALWCESVQRDSRCFFLNELGYAFATAPELEGGALTRYVIEDQGELKQTNVVSREMLATVDEFSRRIDTELGLRTTSVYITKDNDLHYFINGGGELLVAPGSDTNTIFENLRSILNSKQFSHIKPGNFKYIDLRFGNKVYVNEDLGMDAVATTTATSTE